MPECFFRYRLQQKVVYAQPERMQGKIQIAAPDDARFGEKRPQVLHCIQPIHARKGNYSVGRRIFARDLKEYLLPAVAVYLRKQTALGAEPRKLLCVKNFLCFTLCQHGNVVHSVHVSVSLPAVRDEEEAWSCEINANKAILALKHRGGGPAHINLATTYSRDYSVKELPSVRVIDRICAGDRFPEFPEGKVAVFVGSHPKWTSEQTEAVDRFCEAHDAVVFCDHTSNYKGRYRVLYSLVQNQKMLTTETNSVDLLIHIGEVSASYYPSARTVWRVSEDGEIRDTFHKLRYVFEMSEQNFFGHYAGVSDRHSDEYLKNCRALYQKVYDAIPQNLPFSNVWTAYKMAPLLPENSVLHFGILNTLRSWNFFEIPKSVFSDSNVGGFGIDGGVSSLIGASLADPTRLCFGIFGDLAFFYDMNAVGNRHVGNNVRILIINNGRGTEFRQYDHPGALFGDEADPYIAAAGHFGNKSQALIRHYAEDLGFEYMCASDKNEFEALYERFLSPEPAARPMLFEVFTDSGDESDALRAIRSVEQNTTGKLVDFARSVMSEKQKSFIKKTLGR